VTGTRLPNGFVEVAVDFRPGDTFMLEFPLRLAVHQPVRQELPAGYHRFFHGPLLLGSEQAETVKLEAGDEFTPLGRGRYSCQRAGVRLAPINDLTYRSEAEARADRRQVLFPEG
jgi:hypothetical protein